MQGSCSVTAHLFGQPDERELNSISLTYQDLYTKDSEEVLKDTIGIYMRAIQTKGSNAQLILRRIVKSLCDLCNALEPSVRHCFETVEDRLDEVINSGSKSASTLVRERTAFVLRLLLQYKMQFNSKLGVRAVDCARQLAYDKQASVRHCGILLCSQFSMFDIIAELCDDCSERNRLTAIKALPNPKEFYAVLQRRARDVDENVRIEVFRQLKELNFEDVKPELLAIIIETAAYDRSAKVRTSSQEIFNGYFTDRLNLAFCCEVTDKVRRFLGKRRFLKAYTGTMEQLVKHSDSQEFVGLIELSALHTDYRACNRSTLLIESCIIKHHSLISQIPFTEERILEIVKNIEDFVFSKDYFSAEQLFTILTSSDTLKLQFHEAFQSLWHTILRTTEINSTGKYWSIAEQNFKPPSEGLELIKLVVKTCQTAMGVEEFITTIGEYIQDLQEEIEASRQIARNSQEYIHNLHNNILSLEAMKEIFTSEDNLAQANLTEQQICSMKEAYEEARQKQHQETPQLEEMARILILSCELMRNCDRMAYCFDFKTHVYRFAMTCLQSGYTLLTLAIEVLNLYCYLEPEAFEENADLFLNWLNYSGDGYRQVRLVALTAVFDNLLMKDYFSSRLAYTPANAVLNKAIKFLSLEEEDVLNIAVEGFSKLLLFDRITGEAEISQVLRSFLSMFYSEVNVTDFIKQTLQVFLRNYALISLANCKALVSAMKLTLSQQSLETSLLTDNRMRVRSKETLKHLLGILTVEEKIWKERYNFNFSFLVFLILKAIEFAKSAFSDLMVSLAESVKFDDFSEKECYVADVLLNQLNIVKPRVQARLKKNLQTQLDKLVRTVDGQDLLDQVTREHDERYNFLFSIQLKPEQDSDVMSLPKRRRAVDFKTPKKIIKIED